MTMSFSTQETHIKQAMKTRLSAPIAYLNTLGIPPFGCYALFYTIFAPLLNTSQINSALHSYLIALILSTPANDLTSLYLNTLIPCKNRAAEKGPATLTTNFV